MMNDIQSALVSIRHHLRRSHLAFQNVHMEIHSGTPVIMVVTSEPNCPHLMDTILQLDLRVAVKVKHSALYVD